MEENGIAKALRVVGIVEVVCSIILALVVWSNEKLSGWIGLGIIAAGVVTCVLLLGFSEVVELLDQSTATQAEMIEVLKNRQLSEAEDEKRTRKDESN